MYQNSLEYAQKCDAQDPLKKFRDAFHFPKDSFGNPQIYLCGNSLGLQPKKTATYLQEELKDWAELGVEGHTEAKHPWMPYHEFLTQSMANIVGAKPEEVVIMNGLTANLHFMMVSFYQPTPKRYKIIIEKDAFPSDKYAVESQLKFHGFDPKEGLLLWEPPQGEELCRLEDLQQLLEDHQNEVALVMIGNTNYYTGQWYPIKEINPTAVPVRVNGIFPTCMTPKYKARIAYTPTAITNTEIKNKVVVDGAMIPLANSNPPISAKKNPTTNNHVIFNLSAISPNRMPVAGLKNCNNVPTLAAST